MKTYTRILIAVGIVVIVAAGGWYWYSQSKTVAPATTENDLSVSPSDIAPLASVTPITIAYGETPTGWKTYASASAGFSVSYPSDWQVGPCAPGCTGWAPPTAASGQYVLGVIQSTGTLTELIASAEPYLAAKEEIKAGANTWIKLTLQQPMTGAVVTSHFIEHGGKVYEFGTATADADILKVYGSMIRSLVFTK